MFDVKHMMKNTLLPGDSLGNWRWMIGRSFMARATAKDQSILGSELTVS